MISKTCFENSIRQAHAHDAYKNVPDNAQKDEDQGKSCVANASEIRYTYARFFHPTNQLLTLQAESYTLDLETQIAKLQALEETISREKQERLAELSAEIEENNSQLKEELKEQAKSKRNKDKQRQENYEQYQQEREQSFMDKKAAKAEEKKARELAKRQAKLAKISKS